MYEIAHARSQRSPHAIEHAIGVAQEGDRIAGEIIDVKLRKSSGVHAYDDAVQRAILKASPLPKPVPADLFQRSLELHFRPLDQ